MKNRYASVAYGGMDVHYKSSHVTLRDAAGAVVVRERLDHADRASMRAQVARWPQGTAIVLEASFGWGWVSDVLEELGMKPQLSNCYKVQQMRKARGWVKTNRKDADLVSMLPAETTPWWEVWRAPADVRDRREWMRYRAGLVGIQTETKNRIHALFHRHGIFFTGGTDLFGGVGRRFLVALCQDGRHAGGELPEGARASLNGLVHLVTYLRTQLAAAAKPLRELLDRDPLTKRLDGIPGFGPILSHTVRSEIGEISRFRSHRALASYACLAPRSDDTGEADPTRAPLGRHLGDRGNRTLKWAFIEAAHGAVRHGGRWRAMFDRATDGGKKNRGRGYIQVARELVTMVYIVWSRNVAYLESPPARPGTRSVRPTSPLPACGKNKKRSRPGTGQPSHPMVPALTGRETSL
jgi:transposase